MSPIAKLTSKALVAAAVVGLAAFVGTPSAHAATSRHATQLAPSPVIFIHHMAPVPDRSVVDLVADSVECLVGVVEPDMFIHHM